MLGIINSIILKSSSMILSIETMWLLLTKASFTPLTNSSACLENRGYESLGAQCRWSFNLQKPCGYYGSYPKTTFQNGGMKCVQHIVTFRPNK